MVSLSSLAFACIIILCPVLCCAQRVETPTSSTPVAILFGPIVGFAYEGQSSDISVYNTDPSCGVFGTGRALTPSAGASLLLPGLFTPQFGLLSALRIEYSTSRLTALPVDPTRILDESSNTLVELEEENRLESRSWSITADVLGSWRVSDAFGIAVGPRLRYEIATTRTQTNNILGPGDYRHADGQSAAVVTYGTDVQTALFTVSPMVRFMTYLPFGGNGMLIPSVDITTDLMSRARAQSLRSFSIGASLALMFDITPTQPLATPTTPSTTHVPALTASIELYGIDENDKRLPAAQIQVIETYFRQYAPLLPAVFFEGGAQDIPDRYVMFDKGSAEVFEIDSLRDKDLLDIQHQVLNVIGSRMRKHAASRLLLAGIVSRDEGSSGLATARAYAVREYLQRAWEIDSSRLEISPGRTFMERSNEATADGRADNRRVEMFSDDPRILAPVTTQQVVRDFNPPIIKMKPVFRAEAGVKRWDLTITQENTTVALYSSDSNRLTDADLTWQIVRERIDSALAPLVATLIVVDSTDAIATARDEAELVMIKRPRIVDNRVERTGDRERTSYSLVAFDFRSAHLDPQNDRAIQAIAASVRNGARVTVTGYTDRIGSEQQNRELAQQRADQVGSVLGSMFEARNLQHVELRSVGAGVETNRFTNDLPEGRILSRGVTVVVEQPITTTNER